MSHPPSAHFLGYQNVARPSSVICLFIAFYLLLFFETAAVAQCRVGSGPDHHDGVPYCNTLPQKPATARSQTWVTVSAAVAFHADANDFWGVWDVREEQGGVAGAEQIVLESCKKVMGEGCFIAAAAENASIGVAKDVRGFLWAKYGDNRDVAQANVMAECQKSTGDCHYIRTITATPWQEFTDVAGIDALKRYNPNHRTVHGRYASVATTVNRAPPSDTKAWVSSGHLTEPEASNTAKERCQSDSQVECVVGLISMDGHIFAYRSTEGEIGLVVTRNVKHAEREMAENCKAHITKCTVMKIIDAKQSVMEVLDSKIAADAD